MGTSIKRGAVAAIMSVIALAGLPGLPAAAASSPKAPPLAAGSYRQLPAPELVNVRQLRAAAPGAHSLLGRPKLVKNHAAAALAPTLPSPKGGGKSAATPTLPKGGGNSAATPMSGIQGTVLEQLEAFPGMDVATGVTLFGQSNNMEPPDTQIAAGPNVLVEMVNANMTVWSKTGARLAGVDLNVFYGAPAGYGVTDPRVLYDRNSGRFIASAVAIADTLANNSWNSLVYVAVSQTSDPTGTWAKQALKSTSAVLIDQPKVGTSDDKITLDWSEWLKPGCDPANPSYACFYGEVFSVVDKADLLVGGPGYEYLSGRDGNHYAVVPVQALSSTTTQYMTYNNADPFFLVENQCAQPPSQLYGPCPTIGILSITGSARNNTIAITEADPPTGNSTIPPNAVQLGSAGLIDTGDNRLLTAVWQNNQLWTSSTEGNNCPVANPNGSAQFSCLKIMEVLTDTMQVQHEYTLLSGDFSYHPGISLDDAGDVFLVFSRSSSTTYPSAWMTGLPVSTPNNWSTYAQLKAGTGPYDSRTTCGGHNRWGDYSGASVDAADPTDVWVAGEYAVFDTRNCTWATAIGLFTYSAPTVTSITPNTGPGGTAVTIKGTNFVTGNTTPYFGATPSQSNTTTVQTPWSLTTTAPPGNGLVLVSAATLDGHGPGGPTYKYPRLEAAPGSFATHSGVVARDGAPPPHVTGKTPGPRPSNTGPNLSAPSVGETRQPVRRRLQLL
jgi:IPT/TIG domain